MGSGYPVAPQRPWIDRALRLMATALPFGLALARATSAGQWRDDLPAVRDLGLVAVGVGGGLSTPVTQALGLLPLGPRTFRAALGSTLALGVAAYLLYGLVRRLLLAAEGPARATSARPGARGEGPPQQAPHRLASVLAAIATLTAALSPTWQREATVGGGAMIAVAGALAALSVALRCLSGSEPSGRAWIGVGALLGATLAESPPAGLSAIAAIGAVIFATRGIHTARGPAREPPRRALLLGSVAGVLTAAVLLAPVMLRPIAPGAWADLGRTLSASSLSALDVASARTTALSAWIREVGAVSLAIAAAGTAIGLYRARTRPLVAPLVVLLVLDTLLPARAAGVLSADPLTALRSLAVAAIAAGSALGVRSAVRALLSARVPLARSAAVLVVVFHVTLIALASEEAGFAADRSRQMAAEVWADEALGGIQPRSAILVRSPAIAWRLWAARVTRGERPDVVVIPIPLLNRGRVAASLLAAERKLEPLLRDFALTGEPSEFALSTIADVRPLHVELDRSWSKRLLKHLSIDGLWVEYAPQPLGASDRKVAVAQAVAPLRRAIDALGDAAAPDASTASVLAATMRGHSSVCSLLGERVVAQTFLDRVGELTAQDPFVSGGPIRRALAGVRQASVARRLSRRRVRAPSRGTRKR